MSATAEKGRTATYTSKYPNYEQILFPGDELRNERGIVHKKIPRTVVTFEGGRADVVEQPNGSATVNGKPVSGLSFEEIVERLESLPAHGSRFLREEALEPEVLHPTEEELERFLDSEEGQSSLAVRKLLALEQGSHNRPEVVQTLTDAAIERATEEARIAAEAHAADEPPAGSKVVSEPAEDESEPAEDSAAEGSEQESESGDAGDVR